MLRIAFSTVACQQWTLERVAAAAADWGYTGVELRSFGEGGGPACDFACDPALTAGPKVRAIFDEMGVQVAGVASGCRFDDPVTPPVIGDLLPGADRSVREGKHLVSVAAGAGAEYLRVYAFQIPKRERRHTAIRRICERLYKLCDYARNRELRVVIENGGDFSTAADLVEIIDRVNWPLLRACYDLDAAVAAGDDIEDGVKLLGARLHVARVRDRRNEKPCRLGEGELPVREFVRAVETSAAEWNTTPWVVVTWDRAWIPQLASAESVLLQAATTLLEWSGEAGGSRRPGVIPGRTPQSVAPAMMLPPR